MKKTVTLMEIYKVDSGFSRIIYKGKNPHGQTVYYAISVWKGIYEIHRLSKDGEAQCRATAKVPLKELFELPTGMSDLCVGIRNFIERN